MDFSPFSCRSFLSLSYPLTLASFSAATSASALFEPAERSASHSRTRAVWKATSEDGERGAAASAEAFVLVAAAAAAAAPRDARLGAGAVVAMTEGEAAESFSLSKRERAREREMERETGGRLVVGRGKSAKREERELSSVVPTTNCALRRGVVGARLFLH